MYSINKIFAEVPSVKHKFQLIVQVLKDEASNCSTEREEKLMKRTLEMIGFQVDAMLKGLDAPACDCKYCATIVELESEPPLKQPKREIVLDDENHFIDLTEANQRKRQTRSVMIKHVKRAQKVLAKKQLLKSSRSNEQNSSLSSAGALEQEEKYVFRVFEAIENAKKSLNVLVVRNIVEKIRNKFNANEKVDEKYCITLLEKYRDLNDKK